MEDAKIIELFWERLESAIAETDKKYHNYCQEIGMNILRNILDTEECINDCYFKTWNAIPPKRPNSLRAFVGKIMRNLSLDKYRAKNTLKRKEGEFWIVLSELEDCIPSEKTVWDSYSEKLLSSTIDSFLKNVSDRERYIFLKRYFFCKSIREISEECSITEGNIKIILYRIRINLKKHLEKEGYEI